MTLEIIKGSVTGPVNKIQQITSEKELLEVFGKPSLPDISLNDILKFANDAGLRQIKMEKKDDGLTPEEQGPCT